jgi:restriction system protein
MGEATRTSTATTSVGAGRRLWMIRVPKAGRAEEVARDEGLLAVEFGVRADLSDHFEREVILDEVIQANPGEKATRVDAMAGQLDALVNGIQAGDLVLCPFRKRGTIGIGLARPGVVTDADGRPAREVEWLERDLPRDAMMPDLRHSMESVLSVCEISRNGAVARIEAILKTGADPGPADGPQLPEDPEILEALLRARLARRLGSLFAGHGMARLVGAILEAQGWRVQISPPGPDGGIDILAGRGPLGMDAPRLVVQVKSGDVVAEHATLQQLLGALQDAGADQGLLVAWGGVTRPVRTRASDLFFRVRIWGPDEIVAALLETYDSLPADIRDAIPMRRAWIPTWRAPERRP